MTTTKTPQAAQGLAEHMNEALSKAAEKGRLLSPWRRDETTTRPTIMIREIGVATIAMALGIPSFVESMGRQDERLRTDGYLLTEDVVREAVASWIGWSDLASASRSVRSREVPTSLPAVVAFAEYPESLLLIALAMQRPNVSVYKAFTLAIEHQVGDLPSGVHLAAVEAIEAVAEVTGLTAREAMATRTARYHGTCGDCGRHFAAGTLIEWRPGFSSPVDCSCKSAAAPAPVAVQVQAPVVAMVVASAPAPEASSPAAAPTVRRNQSAGWCEACVTALKPGEGRVVACNGCERHWGVEGWLHVFCADGEACAARLAARTARFERQRAARKARETRAAVRQADVDPAARRIARARLVAELGPLAARLALGGEHMTLALRASTARLPWHVTPPRREVCRRPLPRTAVDAVPKLRRGTSPTRSPRTRGWSASGAWPSGHPPSKST